MIPVLPHSLILSDSITKGIRLKKTVVVTRPGATPKKILEYITRFPVTILNYKVIVLHIGTNWLSQKAEWSLYLRLVNNVISSDCYREELAKLNPPPANGPAIVFRDTFVEIINFIMVANPQAKILLSALLPRKWDHDRRHLIRISYNNILKKMADGTKIFFIETYRPFFDSQGNLKNSLFAYDGLHLSYAGSTVLRTFLCDKIDRAMKNLLV